MKKYLFALLLIFLAPIAAQAAGGTCPSAANYTSLTTPTGSLVTLATLGINGGCYFIAAAGSDSNTGTDEAHPWQHAPQMPNCINSCATLQNTPVPAGTGFIFKGGDTWHFGNNTGAYTGGTWQFNNTHTFNGTTANPVYFGVDITWFTGGSWVRPILTWDNQICGSATVGVGSCSSGTITGGLGITQYFVSSCSFGGSQSTIDASARKNYIFDNFEELGLCQNTTGSGSGGVAVSYNKINSLNGQVTFTNLYIHGSSHVSYGAQNGNGCNGITCFGILAFDGSATTDPGDTLFLDVVDFSDSDGAACAVNTHGGYNIAYNVFIGTSQFLANNLHVFHDNLYSNFYENGHSNVLESGNGSDVGPISAVYNNVFAHIEQTGPSGGVGLWLGPCVGCTDYVFNNLMYDVGPLEYTNIGSSGHTFGNYVWFNNTLQSNVNQALFSCVNLIGGTMTDFNNHMIVDSVTSAGVISSAGAAKYYGGSSPNFCNGVAPTVTTSLQMNNSTATTDGYTNSQTFAYSPINAGAPSVLSGTNVTSTFIAAMLASSDSLIVAAGTAAGSDSTYACTYNSTTHVNSCPARTPTARPGSGAVDTGYREFSSAGTVSVAPSSMAFGSVNIGVQSGAQTVTLTNASGGSITFSFGTPSYSSTGGTTGTNFLTTVPSSCTGTLASLGTCTVSVACQPGSAGALTDTLNISYTGAAGSPQTVGLTCTGVTVGIKGAPSRVTMIAGRVTGTNGSVNF